jgi:hypothetical protein
MNRIRLNLHAVALLLIAAGGTAAAGEWPDNPKSIVSSFGSPGNGRFSRGIEFSSGGQRVNAWSDGEVIWTSGGLSRSNAPPASGLVVIEHEGGFRSAYRGIETRPDLDEIVSGGEWLGYAGRGSWSFEILDNKRARIVDPLSLLPSRTGLSSISPGPVELRRGKSQQAVRDGLETNSGPWDILIKDLLNGADRALPLEISLYWVGVRVGTLRFDALAESGGGMVLETPESKTYQDIFDNSGQIRFPEVFLNAGRGTLELRVKDESGRVAARSWVLNLR